jgi:hypothetical protein
MFIAEVIIRKNYIKLQIDELKNYLINTIGVSNVNETLTKLYELEDESQRYRMLLDRANRQLEVEIGNSKVSVSTALELSRNTCSKVDVITELIAANKNSLDIFNLLDQRAKLMEEWIMISRAIRINDWSNEIE